MFYVNTPIFLSIIKVVNCSVGFDKVTFVGTKPGFAPAGE